MALVELSEVSRIYTSGDHELRALDHVNLSLEEGRLIVIPGPSGAGKSTLLNLLGSLDSPTSGTSTVDGRDISTLSPDELAEYRTEKPQNRHGGSPQSGRINCSSHSAISSFRSCTAICSAARCNSAAE